MYNKLLASAETADKKKELRELIEISKPLTLALLEVIQSDIEDCDVVDIKDFDSPSWAVKTAYKQGLKKGLTKFKEYVII